MNITLRKLYRYVFCRGGHGVHSPFVFDLITKVIEEKQAYYCYEPLQTIRWQLQSDKSKIKIGDQELSLKRALRRHCFSTNECELLFRLCNYFQPTMIGAIGSGFGLVPLYLTGYSKSARCIVFEPEPAIAQVARNVYKKAVNASIDMIEKTFYLHPGLQYDFMVWGSGVADEFSMTVFEKTLPHITEKCVIVISGINDSSQAKQTWRTICAHPRVTVTLDLYTLGIVCFHPQLNRRTYKCFISF